MFKNLNTDPNKKPRLLGELGDLSHAKISSNEFKYSGVTRFSVKQSLRNMSIR
jgi:hypothetical protein